MDLRRFKQWRPVVRTKDAVAFSSVVLLVVGIGWVMRKVNKSWEKSYTDYGLTPPERSWTDWLLLPAKIRDFVVSVQRARRATAQPKPRLRERLLAKLRRQSKVVGAANDGVVAAEQVNSVDD